MLNVGILVVSTERCSGMIAPVGVGIKLFGLYN
jgi:hypothetical protein